MIVAKPGQLRAGYEPESLLSGLTGAPRALLSILLLVLCTGLAYAEDIESVEGPAESGRAAAAAPKPMESANPRSRTVLPTPEYLGRAVCGG